MIYLILLISLMTGCTKPDCTEEKSKICKSMPTSSSQERQDEALCEIGAFVDCHPEVNK